MKAINAREALTEREREVFDQEMASLRVQAEFQLKYKEMELDIRKIETRWTQVFRLPFALISLPIRLLFGVSYIVHAIRKTQPDQKFWDYLNKL